MRVRECSWPPSLVVEWLCRQLEQRGIPGTLYAHTVLSLLHSHYCLHSATPGHQTASGTDGATGQALVVGTPPAVALLEHCASLVQDYHRHQCSVCRHSDGNSHGAADDTTIAFDEDTLKQHDSSSRLLLGGAGLLKGALLEEEEELILGESLHPDADLPLVHRTPNKTKPEQKQICCCESISRRARKRHKKLLQQELSLESFSPERLQKLTALQCLLSASDQERSDLEALLEELCKRLKASACHADGGVDCAPPPSPPPPPPPVTHDTNKLSILKKGSKANRGDETSEQSGSDAQRYFAAFPALPRDPESGPNTSSLTSSPVADCVWGCKETCGHGFDDSPPHATTTNIEQIKPHTTNNNKPTTRDKAAASHLDRSLSENIHEITRKPSPDFVCSRNNSPLQTSPFLIVDQDPQNLSYTEEDFSPDNFQTTVAINNCNSSDSPFDAPGAPNAYCLSNDSKGKSADDEESCSDTPTLVGHVGEENLENSFTPSAGSVKALPSQLIGLPGDDESNNSAHLTNTGLVQSNHSQADERFPDEAFLLKKQSAAQQSFLEDLDTSVPIHSDLDLDFLVTTTDAPFKTQLDTFTDSLKPCKLYSVDPNSAEVNSLSPPHSSSGVESLNNFVFDLNKTSTLDLSALQNLGDSVASPQNQRGYSIWEPLFSPLTKLALQTKSSRFNWKNNVPESTELTKGNDLEKWISGCAEITNNDSSVSLHNTNTLQSFRISPSDLKNKPIVPSITKRISPSDLKSKRKLPFSNDETLFTNIEDQSVKTYCFQDRIVLEQAEAQLTAGHGMERSDQMSSVVSGQHGVMPQPQYQNFAAHQISFGDIEPPIESGHEQQQHRPHHYQGGEVSHNAPNDLKLLCLIEAQADQRSAGDCFIVTTSAGGAVGVGNTSVNSGENFNGGIAPSSTASVYPAMLLHQSNPLHQLTDVGPLSQPASVSASNGGSSSSFNHGYGGAYDTRQGCVDEPIDGGYVGDISSRESSEDREDYDEALADDEDDEGDQRHGAARRQQPEEEKRRRLSEKRRTRLSSQSSGHNQQYDGQVNAFAAYRGGVPLPPPPPTSMLSSQEHMQLEQQFMEDHQRNFFERRQQELQQQQQLNHLKQMNFLQEQLLFMQQQQQQQQQESQQHVLTSAADSGNLAGSSSSAGNFLFRPPGEEPGNMAAPEPNVWDQNLCDLDSNVKHTLAQYLELLNQPNSKSSLLAPTDPFSPSTENNRSSATISDYLLKSLMDSPRFGPSKADDCGDSAIRRSVSNDHQDAWLDQNANSLSSSVVSAPLVTLANCQPPNSSIIGGGYDNDDEEKSLCKTFQSLGLERIWDSDAATSANDEYAQARQQMLQAGSLYQLSDQFMHQQHNPPQHQASNNSGARMWTSALQSQTQLQHNDPGQAGSSIINPTFLRLSSSQNEPGKDLSCYSLTNLQLFRSAMSGVGQSQQPLRKQSVLHDLGISTSHSSGMDLREPSVVPSASGPGGVQAVLHRSTQSNFSSVVPRKANVQGPEYLKPTTLSDAPKSVEENLLTSPRTHFRPIKLHDETTANGTLTTFTATSTHVQLSLPYQRSNSGTLYLEKDAIDGSPKKYMVYKDPADKTVEHRPLYMPNQESSLVPKFKVVKNEKYSQTDATNHDLTVVPCSAAATSSRVSPLLDSDDDYDVFAFQKNDLAPHGAFQKQDRPSHDTFQTNNLASRGAFHKIDQAYRATFKRVNQESLSFFQRNDQSSNDAFRNDKLSHDTFQKNGQAKLGTFQNNDLPPTDASIRNCWADNPMKDDGWKAFNLNNNLMNNGSRWVSNTDIEHSDHVREAQSNGRADCDPHDLHANGEIKQRWSKTTEASPSKSFCRNLLGPVLDSDTPTSTVQLGGGNSRRKDRVIDTPAARAIWSSDPSTSVAGQQCHQAVIAAQHIDPAIKALWANSPEDKLKLVAAVAAAASYNGIGNRECNALPAWTMKSRVSSKIEQQIPTEWLTEQSILYTAEENKREDGGVGTGGGDDDSCVINFPEHLANYYPQDEAWSSGDDCAPSNTSDFVRAIWSKGKQASWNANEDRWQNADLKKTESVDNWNGKPGQILNQNNEIWKKEGSEDWGNPDNTWHRANVGKWSDGEDGPYSQIRDDQFENLPKYSQVRWSQADVASSKQTISGGGIWPVLSCKDHLDDLALLAEAQNWEKAVNLSSLDCQAPGGNSNNQQQMSNKDQQQEDLEELDPGWQLQEGFVWDPHTGNTPRKIPPQQQQQQQQQQQLSGTETDDFDDTASQSSGGSSSSEVVMVQTEDGGTLAVQVEYLDEELYDRIFGAPDLQMAGSLPDLPNNQAGLKMLRERWLPPWRRPCTFFMEGSCRRKHCKFSHDLSSITCRFWQDGSCLKGSECPFLHGYPVLPRRRNRSEGDSRDGNRGRGGEAAADGNQGSVLSQQLRREGGKQRHRLSSFEISSETDFPSLGTATDTKESERGGGSGLPAGGSSNNHQNSGSAYTSGTTQLSAQSTPQQPQQMRKKTKYTPITAAILQASTNDSNSSSKGRRRRHTHSAQRSRTPDCHNLQGSSAALSTSAHATGPAPPLAPSLLVNSCHSATKGTLIIKPGTTLTGTASNGKMTTTGASVAPVKGKPRRNRSKVKEPGRSVMTGVSVSSTADGGGGRVHGDGTMSDY